MIEHPLMPGPRDNPYRGLARQTLVVLGLVSLFVVGAVILWRSVQVLLILYLGALLAMMVDGVARWIAARTPLPRRMVAIGVVMVGLGAMVGLGFLVGPQLSAEFSDLGLKINEAWQDLRAWLEGRGWGAGMLRQLERQSLLPTDLQGLSGAISAVAGTVAMAAGVLVVTLYGSAEPKVYSEGLLRLVPPAGRARAREIGQLLVNVLRRWMMGQLLAMVVLGSMAAVGLFLLDVELAGALALLTGLLCFIPFIGPWLAMPPVLLVAGTQDDPQLIAVAVLYYVIQFLETNFITPLVQRYAISFPPALLITVQFVMAATVGLVGVVVATPLVVTVIILVQTLYLQDALGDDIKVMGYHPQPGPDPSPAGSPPRDEVG